ncbi:MAG: D-alanyl-D-alanine carboxypeptidase/D-alanyl-D-alanine-endopeptidase [Chromatiaceae bacterium]|nr:D-alanyl-D-alanine carboxypeptidase/D-alanyl-D-alanine-endopeptidase [Chromatiaceae bacterium]
MTLPAPVAKQLRKHKIAPDDASFYVHKLSEAAPRIAFNADTPRNPASTIKLLTTTAGLGILGPTYSWKTVAYAEGTIAQGRLEGNLIIKGYGDPNLTPEALWRLLWGIRERGVETIVGDLILDNSYFEPLQAGRGDFDGNPNSAYNALPSALSVNLQTTRIHLTKDDPNGDVRVFTDPPLANLSVDNRLRLVNAPCKRKYHKPTVSLVEEDSRATLRLTGTFATDCGESTYEQLLLEPTQHIAGAIVALWRTIGGRIEGAVREGTLPAGSQKIYALSSPSLEEVIRLINKRSNNLMARTLFLTLGAERLRAPGSLPKSRRAVIDWLDERGLTFPELVLDNGSGLSRETRISARSMGRLLGYVYAGPNMSELLSSLAIAGVDGTMRKRFRKSSLKGRAHIKTGTIRGGTGIAGFVLDRLGERWIVVSLINNKRLQTWRGKDVENTLLRWVYETAGDEEDVSRARVADQNGRSKSSMLQANATPEAWFLSPKTSTP